jgi:ubiquinone/menaquinone biosynthesis C-methylase UbiE
MLKRQLADTDQPKKGFTSMSHHPAGAGKSSYDLIDRQRFWRAIALQEGMTVLDLACGAGRYLPGLAGIIGPSGKIIAIDLWAEGIAQIPSAVQPAGPVIETHVADVGRDLPVDDHSVDLCLMATVLHDLVQEQVARSALAEVARVLKPAGILSVIEFKKQDGPPGPPREIRLRPEDVAMLLMPVGLIRFGPIADLGTDLWFAEFRRLGRSAGQ